MRQLTAHQDRAQLGSGQAGPVRFKAQLLGAVLLASDGFFKYTRATDIRACAARVVDGLRGAHSRLEQLFDAEYAERP